MKNKGITLVALVVTIIILLILAGIAIAQLTGNGLFENAKLAKEKYSIEDAREKLETELMNLQIDKNIEVNYNNEEYIDNKLTKKQMSVIGDIVIVDGWKFEINRNSLKIEQILGKGEESQKIEILPSKVVSDDFVSATVKIKITTDEEIKRVTINGEDESIPAAENGVYSISKIVKENGIYSIVVIDKNESYKTSKVEVTDLTENMEIWSKADMENFRDKVNNGRTFEGRTVKLMADIDLVGDETNQWLPIANYGVNNTLTFKGIFDGNNSTISGIYINTASNYQGLFGKNEGVIQKLTINGQIMSTGNNIGGIVGYNANTILNCKNNAYVKGADTVGGIAGINTSTIEKSCNTAEIYATVYNAGGIYGVSSFEGGVPISEGNVKLCYNQGYIHAEELTAGGIGGYQTGGNTYNCYNLGKVYSKSYVGGINGASGHPSFLIAYTYNCYNLGTILSSGTAGQITGYSNANGGSSQDVNCYTTDVITESLNANDYSKDEDGKYVWINDIQNSDLTWKYNNGFPILKWQLEK